MDSNLDQSLDEDEEVIEETALHTRRVTSLDNIRTAVNLSVQFHPVTFIPLGKPGNKYTNWVGLETRSKISILVSDWKKVDKSSKLKQPISFSMPAKMLTRPRELQNFYTRLNSKDEWRKTGVRFEAMEGVFGAEKETFIISYDELYDLLRRGMLESGIVAAFMSSLHSVVSQKARNNRCAFLHPDTISATEINKSPSHVTNVIFNAFIAPHNKNKDFFLAPYTQGGHWVLLLVLLKRRTVYFLDPSHLESGKKPESYHIKPLMESAISKFDLSTNVSSQSSHPVTWIMVKCNQQKNTWECGYYVCKWLFHFVMEHQYTFPQQSPWTTESFSDAEVDGIAVVIVNRLNM